MNIARSHSTPLPDDSTRHESSDIRLGAILASAASIVVLVFLVIAASSGTFNIYALPASQVANLTRTGKGLKLPPPPRLEGLGEFADPGNLTLPANESAHRLRSYGWIDREKHIAHVPIAKAMELVVQNGIIRSNSESKRPKVHKPSVMDVHDVNRSSTRQE